MNKFNTTFNTPIRILFLKYANLLAFSKKSVGMLFSAVVFILIPIIAFTLITSRTPAILGMQSFTVLSGSMGPSIPTGSIVYTGKAERPEIGDIITFERKGVNITHRIVQVVDKNGNPASSLISPSPNSPALREIFYKVKGDANSSPDTDLVALGNVIGKVLFNVSSIGRWASYLKTIPGFLFFIIGPTLVFIGFELWDIKKEIEKQTERRVLQRLRIV